MPRDLLAGAAGGGAARRDLLAKAPSDTDWQDQVSAGFVSGVEAIPVAGPAIMSGLNQIKASVHGVPVEAIEAENKNWQAANPIAATSGTVAGTVLPFVAGGAIPLVAKGLGMSGNLATRTLAGMTSGAGIAGADTLVRTGDMEAAKDSALLGGGIGGALPIAGKVLSTAIKGAPRPASGPSAQQIKEVSQSYYKAATGSPAQLVPDAVELLTRDVAQMLATEGVTASGKIVGGFGKVRKAVKHLDTLRGQPVTMQQLQRFEETLQDIAASPKAGEARIGSMLLDQLDQFMDSLPPTAFKGGDGPMAVESLKAGKQTYALHKRTKAVEQAIAKARLNGGGEEALRTQFKAILNSERKRRGFSPGELEAIEAFVTKGGPVGNVFRALQKDGGLPSMAVGALGVRTLMDRNARGGAQGILDMVATGSQSPVNENAGEWLRRMLLQDNGGTALIGPAGYGSLATLGN